MQITSVEEALALSKELVTKLAANVLNFHAGDWTAAFARWDMDGDGKIRKPEFVAWMSDAGVSTPVNRERMAADLFVPAHLGDGMTLEMLRTSIENNAEHPQLLDMRAAMYDGTAWNVGAIALIAVAGAFLCYKSFGRS